jgi:hypothetical protein
MEGSSVRPDARPKVRPQSWQQAKATQIEPKDAAPETPIFSIYCKLNT